MKYFYSAAVMGNGSGRLWHKMYNFSNFPRVTKTLTFYSKIGTPFAIMKYRHSVWNRVGLHNIGFFDWIYKYKNNNDLKNIIVSIAGTDLQICVMVTILERYNIGGIEFNFSCPNVKSYENKKIPYSRHVIYLKLNYKQDPFKYDLDKVQEIRLNSVPSKYFGAWSGKKAQEKNWKKIKEWTKEGLKIAGCSFLNMEDIKKLEDMGCSNIGIGSTILSDPKLIESIGKGVK